MRILFVCLGNICRSPLAEGIMRAKINQHNLDWSVDSAGTASWHIGHKPDGRSIEIASQHGIDISQQKARKFQFIDFEDMASSYDQKQKIGLVLNKVYPGENRSVPDPYYNNKFEVVYQLLDQACDEIINSSA
jgi:protein-tyrosine phosphatase